MSIVHLNQIKSYIKSEYSKHIDLSDVKGKKDDVENHRLSRSLSAFSLDCLSGVGAIKSGASITDSSQDNGIDALYVDPTNNTIYVIQSKWIHSGKGEPSNGDVKKFISGIRDILNCNFSRFNKKVASKEPEILKALNNTNGRFVACLAYTGINDLAEPSRRDICDFLKEVNDVSSYLRFESFNQADLYKHLTITVSGAPINIDVSLKSWGKVIDPNLAYYGQVNGSEIKGWWDEHGISILNKNIRSALGDTEVNSEISETLTSHPSKFWYFNNGVTLIAKKVSKKLVGGGDRDFGTFYCEDLSIVNGAQTISTIGKIDSVAEQHLSDVYVPVRIISLENGAEDFGGKITKSNNLQNRIENRDFVSQDPEQQRLKVELQLDGYDYSIKRDMEFKSSEKSFDLVESTAALACASQDISIIVQLKREISKLWESTSKKPYKTLFNGGVSSTYLFRCVLVNRAIESKLNEIMRTTSCDYSHGIGVHGNRLISGLVFDGVNQKRLKDPSFCFDTYMQNFDVKEQTMKSFSRLKGIVEKEHANAVLPTLFKNKNKCESLFRKCLNKEPCHNSSEQQLELI